MIPVLYNTITEGVLPTDYGVGALTDCLTCVVKEKRNGSYELTLTYAAQGIHADELVPNACIKAKPNYTDNPQLFRIYKVSKVANGRFTVNAQHISYDLSGKVITQGTAENAIQACALLTLNAGDFVINTDKNVTAPFKVKAPSSVRSWFGGKEGSLLDIYGTAEWKYDNFTCSLLAHRGADRGVQIRYGKNLTELSQDVDVTNLVTAVIPYYLNEDEGIKVVGDKITTDLDSDVIRDQAIDFTQDVDLDSEVPIADQLATLAARYIENNILTRAISSIKLSFVQLGELAERVDLCDTVHIYFEALGISTTTKCTETEWNVLEDRYNSVSFGDTKSDITDTIVTQQDTLNKTASKSFLASSVTRATEMITGNLGGYVIIHDSNGDGEPDEILIMNTDDIATATKIWRWNAQGLGYSGTSYGGPYSTAITADGEIVADFITTGTMSADLIKGGVLQLGSNLNQNGTLEVYDEANNLIATLDKNGLKMLGLDGFYLVVNTTDGFAGFDRDDNKLFWMTADEFHMRKSVIEEEITLCAKMRFIPVELYDADDNMTNDGIALVSVY